MKKKYQDFGAYIAEKRVNKGITLREMARRLNFSAPFWSDVEKGRANPPKYEKLMQIVEILDLSLNEKLKMFDLAGKSRESIAPDVDKYILDNHFVVSGIRKARDLGADKTDWQKFIENLQDKNA